MAKRTAAPDTHHNASAVDVNSRHEELLTVHEVARQLRVDDTTVRRWIKAGALDAIPLPHRGTRQTYRIRRSTLEKILLSPPAL